MAHRALVWWLMWGALGCTQASQGAAPVLPGIDVLLRDSSALVTGRRVGLLTNQTGVDRSGTADLDRLLARGVQVTAIFSPEHGFRGMLDQEGIGDTVEGRTGIAIYSLYGAVREPSSEMLQSVDVLVIDLQDIGSRTYTYISTALLAMKAARAHGRAVVVLDRPNPIGGTHVQGPVLDSAFATFVGMLPVALRHGMTFGELARMGNDVLGLGADLTVVPVVGWSRDRWFDATGLPWVRPSPNMPSLESAMHYPGMVLFEGTNLSVGRGTPIAFQVIGAPWLDGAGVVEAVGDQAGVVLFDTTITPQDPTDGKYAGARIGAVGLRVSVRERYDPTTTAVALLAAIRNWHPDSLTFGSTFDRLAGTDGVRRGLERGLAAEAIVGGWRADLAAFQQWRKRYLLYPE